jgi:hypothetical protein
MVHIKAEMSQFSRNSAELSPYSLVSYILLTNSAGKGALMEQSFDYTEPTIWALRKNVRKVREATSSLYEHIYGYDPLAAVQSPETPPEEEEAVRKGSAENPSLNIINPETNFLVRELASDEPSDA